jgi:hypothetical protein
VTAETLTWRKVHDNGPTHAFPQRPLGELLTALCGVSGDQAELLDGDDDQRCHACLIHLGTALADRDGDPRWR